MSLSFCFRRFETPGRQKWWLPPWSPLCRSRYGLPAGRYRFRSALESRWPSSEKWILKRYSGMPTPHSTVPRTAAATASRSSPMGRTRASVKESGNEMPGRPPPRRPEKTPGHTLWKTTKMAPGRFWDLTPARVPSASARRTAARVAEFHSIDDQHLVVKVRGESTNSMNIERKVAFLDLMYRFIRYIIRS
jgi:hypothetical protein